MHKFEKRDAKSRTLVILAVVGLAAAITVGIFTAVRLIRKPAASKDDPKTGIVTMDTSKCVGCKYCIVACPYNVRFINEETKAADNCDFCLHTRLEKNETPACVESCKYDALIFGDINDPKSYVSKLLAVKDSVRIRPELGTEPQLRYIPIVKKGV